MTDPTSNPKSLQAGNEGRQEACCGRRAFSMVELLVVLAVVMALIGILLPGLQSARRTAYGVICGANQRQIGIGLLLWSEDHSGHLPESMLQDNDEFAEMMAVTTGATGEDSRSTAQYDGLGRLWEYRYIDTPQCLHCPAHHHKHTFEANVPDYGSLVGDTPNRVYANYQYTGHCTLESCLGEGGRVPRNMARGGRFVLLTDGLRSREDFNHDVGMNVLFADGSYEWRADVGNAIAKALPFDGAESSSEGFSPNEAVSNIWQLIGIDENN